MAKTYTSTIAVNCWKEHTCSHCGGAYAYQFKRNVSGRAPTAEAATVAAQRAVARTVAEEVDQQPCPACGTYQPDMLGHRRARAHRWVVWLAAITFVTLLVLRLNDVLQTNVTTWAVAGTCAAALLACLAAEWSDPNKDTAANRRLAGERMTAGVVRQSPAAATGRAAPPAPMMAVSTSPARPAAARLGLLLLSAAVLAAAGPELLRMTWRWPLNDACYPPVVGPGDVTRIYMTGKISSVKGFWRGTPTAVVQLPAGAGPATSADDGIPAGATAKDNNWGSTIPSVKDSEKNSSTTPWVEVTLPAAAALPAAAKSVRCDVTLEVAYPALAGSSSFRTTHATMHRDVSLNLSPAGAGARYKNLWWQGTVAGMVLAVVACVLLLRGARALRGQAKPTRTYV